MYQRDREIVALAPPDLVLTGSGGTPVARAPADVSDLFRFRQARVQELRGGNGQAHLRLGPDADLKGTLRFHCPL